MECVCGALITGDMEQCAQCGRFIRPEDRISPAQRPLIPRPILPAHGVASLKRSGARDASRRSRAGWQVGEIRVMRNPTIDVRHLSFSYHSLQYRIAIDTWHGLWHYVGSNRGFHDRYACLASAAILAVESAKSHRHSFELSSLVFDSGPVFHIQVSPVNFRNAGWYAHVRTAPRIGSGSVLEAGMIPAVASRVAGRVVPDWETCLRLVIADLVRLVEQPRSRFQLWTTEPNDAQLLSESEEFDLDPDGPDARRRLSPSLDAYLNVLRERGWRAYPIGDRRWYSHRLRRRLPSP